MADRPVVLDEHRGMAAQKATESRRECREEYQVAQEASQLRQEKLERLISAGPAESWLEAAAKAQYLIELFAATPAVQDPRRKELIAHALSDLKRLCSRTREDS